MLVASGTAYVANVRRTRAPFCRHLTLQPHGLLVGLVLVAPPPVVFALVLVLFALALVDSVLLEVAGALLGVVRELPTAVGRALALKRLDRLDRLRIISHVTLLFAVHSGAVGVVAGLTVIELALFAVTASLVAVELGLIAVELPLLCATVTTLAHYSVSSEHYVDQPHSNP